jgi:zinc D-Ala-D-Ala dipeptidase
VNKIFLLLICSSILLCKVEDLVDVEKTIPGIVLDIKYATKDNFTKQKIYKSARCFLVKPAAEALKKVQADLKAKGFQLKLWDCYRPLSAQKKMWNLVPDERYVSNPKNGGRHTRGTTVDCAMLTLDGKEVEMPTGFDDFTEKAHQDYSKLPKSVLKNKALLKQTMLKHGFQPLATEWWHFDFKGWQKYEPLDIEFTKIK